jgi:hypothetical protein
MGLEAKSSTPAELAAMLKTDFERWGPLVKPSASVPTPRAFPRALPGPLRRLDHDRPLRLNACNRPPAHGHAPGRWAQRQQLAACYRVFALLGWTEMIYNHITLRLPDSVTGARSSS